MTTTADQLQRLNKLIEGFGGSSEPAQHALGTADALLENLQAARRFLLSDSPAEYQLAVERARDSASAIEDSHMRQSVSQQLAELAD